MRRATLIDGSTQSITRDALGRRTAVANPWWSWTVDPQNGYDPAGNLLSYTTVDPGKGSARTMRQKKSVRLIRYDIFFCRGHRVRWFE